ncbi:MAG: hypothetical protein LBI53_06600 [Candidatus Peribacteria bacterium]|nr:hypothetical protein [Candidatus Peribacteria bacterium]
MGGSGSAGVQAAHGLAFQLLSTTQSHGWLDEKVDLLVFGVALPLIIAAAFLLRV